MMDSLFPIEPRFPEGFLYFPDFLSAEEELTLLSRVKELELHNFNFQGFEAKRKVASFGFDYSFEHRNLTRGEEIPAVFTGLIQKVAAKLGLAAGAFAELLVTEYPEGSVINWHRDAPPFDLIAGISLLSDCTFRLRPHDKLRQKRGAIISFPVRHGSLYVMQSTARTDWQHSIAPVKETRFSITLRTLRK